VLKWAELADWLKVYGQLALLGVEIAALMFTFSVEKYVCFNHRNVNFLSSVNALLTLREGEESKVKKNPPLPQPVSLSFDQQFHMGNC